MTRDSLNVPRPLQTEQSWLLDPFFPPEPSHWLQTMFLVLENLVVLPLYSSSSVTSYSCSTLRPFRGTLRPGPPGMPPKPGGIPPIPPMPPNICARISSMSGC